MASLISLTVRLPKHVKNRDMSFRNFQFRDGALTLAGDAAEVATLVNFLKVNLSVEVDGEPAKVEEPSVPEGNRVEGDDTTNQRLVAALKQLDPQNDEHWTQAGKPALAAVEQLYGDAGITRADVDAALPGFSRETAKQGD